MGKYPTLKNKKNKQSRSVWLYSRRRVCCWPLPAETRSGPCCRSAPGPPLSAASALVAGRSGATGGGTARRPGSWGKDCIIEAIEDGALTKPLVIKDNDSDNCLYLSVGFVRKIANNQEYFGLSSFSPLLSCYYSQFCHQFGQIMLRVNKQKSLHIEKKQVPLKIVNDCQFIWSLSWQLHVFSHSHHCQVSIRAARETSDIPHCLVRLPRQPPACPWQTSTRPKRSAASWGRLDSRLNGGNQGTDSLGTWENGGNTSGTVETVSFLGWKLRISAA